MSSGFDCLSSSDNAKSIKQPLSKMTIPENTAEILAGTRMPKSSVDAFRLYKTMMHKTKTVRNPTPTPTTEKKSATMQPLKTHFRNRRRTTGSVNMNPRADPLRGHRDSSINYLRATKFSNLLYDDNLGDAADKNVNVKFALANLQSIRSVLKGEIDNNVLTKHCKKGENGISDFLVKLDQMAAKDRAGKGGPTLEQLYDKDYMSKIQEDD